MILETYLKQIKNQRKKNDSLHIFAEEQLKNGDKINLNIDDYFIKSHPIILKADLIKYGDYETNATDGINGHKYKIKIFYAIVDLDQYKIARQTKGF